jgi:hypothetical protein
MKWENSRKQNTIVDVTEIEKESIINYRQYDSFHYPSLFYFGPGRILLILLIIDETSAEDKNNLQELKVLQVMKLTQRENKKTKRNQWSCNENTGGSRCNHVISNKRLLPSTENSAILQYSDLHNTNVL